MSRLREEFQVIPKAIRVIAILAPGTFATLIFLFAPEPFHVRVLMGAVLASLFCLYLLLVGYVYADSKRRGMRPVLWTLIVVFVPSAIGFLAYFLLREDILTPCGRCGTPARREFAFCPDCGEPLRRACPECRNPVEPFWAHCAHCGLTLAATPAPEAPEVPEIEDEPPDATEASTD